MKSNSNSVSSTILFIVLRAIIEHCKGNTFIRITQTFQYLFFVLTERINISGSHQSRSQPKKLRKDMGYGVKEDRSIGFAGEATKLPYSYTP